MIRCATTQRTRGYVPSKGLVGRRGSPKEGEIEYIVMKRWQWEGPRVGGLTGKRWVREREAKEGQLTLRTSLL